MEKKRRSRDELDRIEEAYLLQDLLRELGFPCWELVSGKVIGRAFELEYEEKD